MSDDDSSSSDEDIFTLKTKSAPLVQKKRTESTGFSAPEEVPQPPRLGHVISFSVDGGPPAKKSKFVLSDRQLLEEEKRLIDKLNATNEMSDDQFAHELIMTGTKASEKTFQPVSTLTSFPSSSSFSQSQVSTIEEFDAE